MGEYQDLKIENSAGSLIGGRGFVLLLLFRPISGIFEKRSSFLFHTLGGVQIHRGRPALPVLALRSAVLRAMPFVKAEFHVGGSGLMHKSCQREQFFFRESTLAGGNQGGDIKSANKRPDSA